MRTTLSLDEDVARLLNRQMRQSGKSFKETVNHYLRLGLAASQRPQRKRFVVTPRRMGLPAGLSYDNVAELLEHLEGPAYK